MNNKLNIIFKAYDIRGISGIELTNDIAYDIARGLADWLNTNGRIMVGRDMRPDSKDLAEHIIKGLTDQGYDVWDIGQVTTDMIYFGVGYFKLTAGVMVTASHNPGKYNGIKLCRENAIPIGEDSGLLEIKNLILRNNFKKVNKKGSVIYKPIINEWIKHALSFIDIKQNFKKLNIAVDTGNGMAGLTFPYVEKYFPFKYSEMFFDIDGTFPNHVANPVEEKNIIDISKRIKSEKLDAGIAFDGDGDRAVMLDENGQALSGTILGSLIAEYFLKNNPQQVILYNAICGHALMETIIENGGSAVRTKVGGAFIKHDMRKYKALLAVEGSGHYYFRDNYMADSGLIAAIIGLYILATSSQSLSELVKKYRHKYTQINETNFEVNDPTKVIKKIADKYKTNKTDQLDGLSVYLDYGWFNIRPSNTEPLLRLNAEAINQKELNKIVHAIEKLITTTI